MNLLLLKKNVLSVFSLSLLFIATIILFSGCISFTPSVVLSEDHSHVNGKGYIYGRFTMNTLQEGGVPILYNTPVTENVEDYYFGYPTLALTINDNAFYYGIEENDRIQIMELDPGTYTIDTIEYLNYEKNIDPSTFSMPGYKETIVVQPNTAVYIGDFSGALGRDYNNYLVWEINDPINNFEKTTEDLKKEFTQMGTTDITYISNMN